MQGAIAFLPIKETVDAIVSLSTRLVMVKQEIYEITAQSDITRGGSDPDKTATAARGEMRVFSQRVQAEQDEFARFASDAQRIRAFLISKFFDAETIAERANIQPDTEDGQLLPQAIEMLKSSIAQYRIDVDADSLAMTDYDAVRQERVEALTALGSYWQSAAPFVEFAASAGPQVSAAAARLVVSSARWLLAGVKGAEALESDFDRFAAEIEEAAKQPPQPPPPDPALEREKIKGEVAMQQAQVDMAKSGMEMQHATAKHGMEMEKLQADVVAQRENARTRVEEARAMPREPRGEA
jgi:hypothetical protein